MKHRLEVELEKRLARQGLVVAQHAQAQAVGDDRPQVAGTAVQELLHETVRVGGGGTALAGGAAIERETAADKMHWHWAEEAADRVGAPANLWASARGQQTEAQLPQQRQAPLVVGEAGSRFAFGQARGAARNSAQCFRRRFHDWVMTSFRRSLCGRP